VLEEITAAPAVAVLPHNPKPELLELASRRFDVPVTNFKNDECLFLLLDDVAAFLQAYVTIPMWFQHLDSYRRFFLTMARLLSNCPKY
jgi:hypothetical protein